MEQIIPIISKKITQLLRISRRQLEMKLNYHNYSINAQKCHMPTLIHKFQGARMPPKEQKELSGIDLRPGNVKYTDADCKISAVNKLNKF